MPINTLKEFLNDEDAWDMFITGMAGTGKTTSLAKVVKHLQENKIAYIVCAYTHKACGVLISKLPVGANITTLHSFLKKRPSINEHAMKAAHVDIKSKFGDSEKFPIIIIDEFSMVGEQDHLDIVDLQSQDDETGKPTAKVIYVGDPYQLLPVKDMQSIEPSGKYWVKLNTVHRTENSDLIDTSLKLISYIEGKPLAPIQTSKNLIRGVDLVNTYLKSKETDKILLAWTNKTVQALNFKIAGKAFPEPGDDLWNSSTRDELIFSSIIPNREVTEISTITGIIPLRSTYKTLEFLQKLKEIKFFRVENITAGYTETIAVLFGTSNYKEHLQMLSETAVSLNKEIQSKYNTKAAQWARLNPTHHLARARAHAWRELLAFKEAVMCVDFPFAMTIHKSQGSTYKEVYLDSEDLSKCANSNITNYARLFYVAVSRASERVITN